jgi:hypothetical protein
MASIMLKVLIRKKNPKNMDQRGLELKTRVAHRL